jgi:GNAT superfamily N-acetyltransferase
MTHPVPHPIRVVRLDSLDDPRHLEQLSAVLIDCVEGGASVSFMHPLARARAEAFWREVGASAARAERTLLVAHDGDGTIVGTVQVVPAAPENQPHRAEICKMLVHRRARRRGVGAALMKAAEQAARDSGRTLLVLDTVPGREGERLYQRLGWQRCGTIPGYALLPFGGLCDTTVYFKRLDP